jgi:transposase
VRDVPPEERPCPDRGAIRRPFGAEVREQLEYAPASSVVIPHVRPEHACESCRTHVATAERLPEPIEKGLPGPGLRAQIAVSKSADHLPLGRQGAISRRFGVDPSRATMCDRMAAAAGPLEPIVKATLKRVLRSDVAQTDAAAVPAQERDGTGIKAGRLGVHIGGADHRFIAYDHIPDRGGAGPERVFEGFEGYLQANAHSASDALFRDGKTVEAGGWMQARRKFYEARTGVPTRSRPMLARIVGPYEAEEAMKKGRKKHPEWDDATWHAHRHDLRARRSRPPPGAIRAGSEGEGEKVLPRSPIGEAIGSALNRWTALPRPWEAGLLEIDNGASERALKSVTLVGRTGCSPGVTRGAGRRRP